MTRYGVQFQTVASTVVYVEADSPDAARELADEKFESPYVCAQCSGWGSRDGDSNSGIEIGEFEQDDSDEGVWEATS